MSFLALYRLFLKNQFTKGRIILIGLIALVALLISLIIRTQVESVYLVERYTIFTFTFGLNLAVPILSLALAGATLGQLVEDETLVYLWLRPIPRSILAFSSWLATATTVIPAIALPFTLGSLLATGEIDLSFSIFIAIVFGSFAYCALFVLLGLLTKRSLIWGLLFIFVWEGLITALPTSIARLSVSNFVRSIVYSDEIFNTTYIEIFGDPVSAATALLVLLLVMVTSISLTTWKLNKANVA